MRLGFVSAILGDLCVEELFRFAEGEGFACVELMCWPPGKAERRHAGVCHVDITDFPPGYADHLRDLSRMHNVAISGLGYYPNLLEGDAEHRGFLAPHLGQARASYATGVRLHSLHAPVSSPLRE